MLQAAQALPARQELQPAATARPVTTCCIQQRLRADNPVMRVCCYVFEWHSMAPIYLHSSLPVIKKRRPPASKTAMFSSVTRHSLSVATLLFPPPSVSVPQAHTHQGPHCACCYSCSCASVDQSTAVHFPHQRQFLTDKIMLLTMRNPSNMPTMLGSVAALVQRAPCSTLPSH